MLVFSSTHITTACSGGFMYSPTTSRTLSTNCGSSDSLNVSVNHGFNPNARQIRPTDDGDIPAFAARSRVDQCVASVGLVLQRAHDHRFDIVIADRARCARAADRRAARRDRVR